MSSQLCSESQKVYPINMCIKRKKPKTSLMYDFNDTNKYKKYFKNIYAKANHEVNPQPYTHTHK